MDKEDDENAYESYGDDPATYEPKHTLSLRQEALALDLAPQRLDGTSQSKARERLVPWR
jgi:hypothetical protein